MENNIQQLSKYRSLNRLYIYQVYALILFFFPQFLGPFFYSFPISETRESYCNINDDVAEEVGERYPQNCMPNTFCKIQGIFNNASWFATSLISFYSNYLICKILKVKGNVHGVPARYAELALILIVIFCNLGSIWAPFQHYGIKWGYDKIYYVCNLALVLDWIWWWMIQLSINGAVIIYGIVDFCRLYKLKQIVKQKVHSNIDQIRTLNINIITVIVILTWSINIILKIIDIYTEFIIDSVILNILWVIPQMFVQLLGLLYAEIFFYYFQQQIQLKLSKPLRKVFGFFSKYNLIMLLCCCSSKYHQQVDIKSEALESNEASLIYNDENTTN